MPEERRDASGMPEEEAFFCDLCRGRIGAREDCLTVFIAGEFLRVCPGCAGERLPLGEMFDLCGLSVFEGRAEDGERWKIFIRRRPGGRGYE